ncbi:MraY family glycosyltransferase [Allostreptomyces psammosilenae]|uniref:UDP-GlcNAc:undecaprenyl-phosphate GlcNAc-1-phosphate transferase n=1 Tax=Allostreptomyces psammosilenae TaxID=1892865 RepID=A0A852ZVK3_9ACTN|nr:MraY family glycosyltransferase [Allostreptomyces psammosilenae]NYI06423.1 UDP-GlcNAc:undecaprenyl-phosphate GlcNAc-1-phosphate transferase [Allostreptomyces psammosilenae]
MREFLLTLLATAAVTYLLTGPVRRFAIAAGAMPPVRSRDVHKEPTPRLGGIAMFGGLCTGLLVASQLETISRAFRDSSNVRALMAGAFVVWVVGVIDDKWEMDGLIKLGGQLLAAGTMVQMGLQILWLPVPGVGTVALSPMQGTLLTVALILITINAVNFVDGLDGLAAGVVCIAAGAFFLYAYRLWFGYGVAEMAAGTLFAAVLLGMCIGFLPHNAHPARIFMGDSGSMLLGLVLCGSAISVTGLVDPDGIQAITQSREFTVHKLVPVYLPLVLPLVVITVPLLDLVLAVVRRTSQGRSPFSADRQHLHHRLLEIGHSHSRAVLIMYFWSALIAAAVLAISVQPGRRPLIGVFAILVAVGLVILLMPRFRPRAPRALMGFLPPRYRSIAYRMEKEGYVPPSPVPLSANNSVNGSGGGTAGHGTGSGSAGPVGATALGAERVAESVMASSGESKESINLQSGHNARVSEMASDARAADSASGRDSGSSKGEPAGIGAQPS